MEFKTFLENVDAAADRRKATLQAAAARRQELNQKRQELAAKQKEKTSKYELRSRGPEKGATAAISPVTGKSFYD